MVNNKVLSFNLRELNSFDDFDIVIAQKPVIPSAQRRVQKIPIPGRNGNLTIDEETYEDITFPVECSFKTNNFIEKVDKVKSWLMGPVDKLIFSDDLGRYYKAQVISRFDIENVLRKLGRFTVIFQCDPFKYSSFNDDLTITQSKIICNPGTKSSEPILTVFGLGDITLTINSQNIILKNVNGYVTVNSEIGDCYRDTLLMNNFMIGEFPVLKSGDNNISFTGNVQKIDITPNWRWL